MISRVSSIAYLEPYSKLFLCEILFPMKSFKQNLTNDFNSSSVSPNIICLYTFAFCGELGGWGEMYTYKHVYINYINSTRTCTLVPNTQI